MFVCLLFGCTSAPSHGGPTIIRLSTHEGLKPLVPGVKQSFSANIADLVFTQGTRVFQSLDREGTHVVLTPRGNVPSDRLVAALRAQGASSVSIVDDKLVVDFPDTDLATFNLESASFDLDMGPYRVARSSSEEIILERRLGDGPDEIDVKAVATQDEEWRRFLAHEVDLLPVASPAELTYLDEVPSVRIVKLAHPAEIALHFQTQTGATANASVRRAIALSLRRGALAASVTSDEQLAAVEQEDVAEARRILTSLGYGPDNKLRLRLLVPNVSTDFARAASIIDGQLASLDIELKIDARSPDECLQSIRARDFDLLIFYGGFEPRYFRLFEPGGGNFSGYQNPEFTRAATQHEDERAVEVLRRDLPATPLYSMGDAVAIDRRFCGAKPNVQFDYTWLIKVHPCRDGETE